MSLRFFIGLPGSGKTHFAHREIRENCIADPFAPPLFLLVPEQISHETERRVLDGGLDASVRMRVLSFRRLQQWCFSQMQKSGKQPINDIHRRALVASILSKLRRQKQTSDIDSSNSNQANTLLRTAGIERTIDGMISELLEYKLDADQISDWANQAESFSRILSAKLRELAEVAREFQSLIEERFETPDDTGNRIGEFLSQDSALQGTEVYLDHFFGFDRSQQRVLSHFIQRSKQVTLLLTISPARFDAIQAGQELDPLSSFFPVEETIRWLFDSMKSMPEKQEYEVKVFPDVDTNDFELKRYQSSELQKLVHGFTTIGKYSYTQDQSSDDEDSGLGTETLQEPAIRFVEHSNQESEAHDAVSKLMIWKKENGWQWRDMAILCRNFDGYLYNLKDACQRAGIPVFIDHLEPLATHPLVRGLECLVDIVFRRFTQESVLTLAKSGFLNLEQGAVSLLEAMVTQLPKSSEQWFQKEPWKEIPSRDLFSDDDERLELTGDIERIRKSIMFPVKRLSLSLDKIKQDDGYNVSSVIELICDIVRDHYSGDGGNAEDVLNQFGQTCQAILESAATDVLPGLVIADLVEDSLHQISLPHIPPTIDQLIIGQADRSRLPEIKGLIVLGLNDGVFPRSKFENSLLNDGEREYIQSLDQQNENLRPAKRIQLARERYHALYAFSRPSNFLVLSRSATDEKGQSIPPSPFWKTIRKLFPNAPIATKEEEPTNKFNPLFLEKCISEVSKSIWGTEEIYYQVSPDSTRVMELLRKENAGAYRSFRQFQSRRNQAKLNPEPLIRSIGKNWRISASSLNAFGDCAFKHFAKSFLRPRQPSAFEASAIEYGNYAHAIMHEMMKDIIFDPSRLDDEDQYHKCFEEKRELIHSRFSEKGYLATQSVGVILNQFDRVLEDAFSGFRDLLLKMNFNPMGTEVTFGPGEDISGTNFQIRVIDGSIVDVTLRGQMDLQAQRVDDPALTAIFDFKLSERKISWQRLGLGADLQFATYFLNLQDFVSSDLTLNENPENLAVLHYHLINKSPEKNRKPNGIVSEIWNELATQSGDKSQKVTLTFKREEGEVLSQRFSKIISDQITQVLYGRCDIAPLRIGKKTACTFCDFNSSCRIDYTQNKPRSVLGVRNDQAFKSFFTNDEAS